MKNKKPDFIKCCKCDKEAEFTSPKNYCFEHWSAWWFSSDIKEGKMTEKEAVAKVKKSVAHNDKKKKK